MKLTVPDHMRLVATGWMLLAAFATSAGAGASPVSGDAEKRELAADVRRQLQVRMPRAAPGIEVEIRDGHVTLRGSVENLPQKSRAGETAESVRGVQDVANELRVEADRRADDELARDVLQALESDPATLAFDFEVAARDGVVTLGGAVDTFPQKKISEWIASGIRGVREIRNLVRIDAVKREGREIHAELARHYATSPLFNDDEIDVQVDEGVVKLSGHVDSALEKNWARDDAWVSGVRDVEVGQLAVRQAVSTSMTGRTGPIGDDEIRQAIVRAFVHDPRVASVNPEVVVEDRVVTLRGAVSNRRAKQAAIDIVRHTAGVAGIVDRLAIEADRARNDAEIAGAVRAALGRSAALAKNEIKVEVNDGRVILRGAVDSFYERWVAGDLVDRTGGVVAVENHIEVESAVAGTSPHYLFPRAGAHSPWVYSRSGDVVVKSDPQLAGDVRRELAWNPLNRADIAVTARNGTVTLSGEVATWSERDAAVETAYEAGAREVVDKLRVSDQRQAPPRQSGL